MSRLRPLLAALCLSALALDSAPAQEAAADPAPLLQGQAAPSADESATAPGWLLRGRQQNRIVNPFRATPAPGTGRSIEDRLQGNAPLGSSLPLKAAPQVPENATANALGKGWTCNAGFRQAAGGCIPVNVPANASLDLSGRGWTCNRGFRREGQGCVEFVLPQNAALDASGTRWACNPGFRRQGETCVAFVVPENASLDKSGRNWVCNAGYQPRGQTCVDEATARLQQDADKAVNAQASGKSGPRPGVSISSGENRQGRTSRARVIIGRF